MPSKNGLSKSANDHVNKNTEGPAGILPIPSSFGVFFALKSVLVFLTCFVRENFSSDVYFYFEELFKEFLSLSY